MRQFATIQSIVDLQGYPVSGDRLLFLVDDEQLATITDEDGNEISNPVKIVNGHTEVQVFLPDVDVKVVQQTLADSENDTWVNVGNWLDKAPVIHIDVAGGTPSVDTVAELKNLDPSVGSVNLLGYNQAGDKPMINYRFYYYAVQSSSFWDEGVKIKSNVAGGGWFATLSDNYVDIRHYGIFPTNLNAANQSARIASAYNSIKGYGKNVYFPSEVARVYYDISGCNINGAKADDGTVFVAKSSDATLRECGYVRAYSSEEYKKINVVSRTVYMSQNVNSSSKIVIKPLECLIIDKNLGMGHSFSGVTVSLEVDVTNSINFIDCDFTGSGKFAPEHNISFTRCRVRQSMFSASCDYSLISFQNCESSISMWSDIWKYVSYCIDNGNNIIDICGLELSSLPESDEEIKIVNAVFTGSVDCANYDFERCVFNGESHSYGSSFCNCEFVGQHYLTTCDDGFRGHYDGCVFSSTINGLDGHSEAIGIIKDLVIYNCNFANCDPIVLPVLSTVLGVWQYDNFIVESNTGAKWSTKFWECTKNVPLLPSGQSSTSECVTWGGTASNRRFDIRNSYIAGYMPIALNGKIIRCERMAFLNRADGTADSYNKVGVEWPSKVGYRGSIDNVLNAGGSVNSQADFDEDTGTPNQARLTMRFTVL